MKMKWMWGVSFKPTNEKDASIQEKFHTREEAIAAAANTEVYNDRAKVVHVAWYR